MELCPACHIVGPIIFNVFFIAPNRQFSWEQIDSVVCTMQPRIESDAELSQCFTYDARLRGLVRQLTVREQSWKDFHCKPF